MAPTDGVLPSYGSIRIFSYLATDGLGSADVTLDASGNLTSATLYAPYGLARYAIGIASTDYGFTGQHSDTSTGLDYYNARYYDPVAGQFTSADTVLPGGGFDIWGLSRYAYVEGNPIVRTDPTGHRLTCVDDPTCGYAYGSGGPTGHANGKPPGPPPATRPATGMYAPPQQSPSPKPCCDLGAAWNTFLSGAQSLIPSLNLTNPLAPNEVCACADFGVTRDLSELKKLTSNQVRQLQQAGEDPEQIKGEMGGRAGTDLYRDPKTGDIFVGPKSGQGVGQSAYLRLKNDGAVEIGPPTVRGTIDELPGGLPKGDIPVD